MTALNGNAEYCCKMMREMVAHEDRLILHWERSGRYLVPVRDGGSSGIVMKFCPWCGSKLPKSRAARSRRS